AGILIRMKVAALLVIVRLAGGVLACGQKGPLVMPDAQKHKRTIPTPPRAPAKSATQPTPATSPPAGSPPPTSPAPPASPIPSPSTPTPTDSSSHP
ncbi:MAG TPA: lipoprotein, partial [Steroidobacteraceae bacterium]